MSAVIVLSIGPVQEFIAQARRSRDLWYGSHLLSELARAAARGLAPSAQLVFPALSPDDEELAPCDGPLRSESGSAGMNIGNKLVATVPSIAIGREAIERAHAALLEHWQALAWDVHEAQHAMIDPAATRTTFDGPPDAPDSVWSEQIDGLVEVYAACCPYGDGTYDEARRRADRLVASRKALRDFLPRVHDLPGRPKSSFDGGRVSVLRPPGADDDSDQQRRKFRIANAENLDAVGVVKRCGGAADQFVPVANVALAPWLEHVHKEASDEANAHTKACRGTFRELGHVHRPDLKWAKTVDYDAQIWLPSRWLALAEEGGLTDKGGVAWSADVAAGLETERSSALQAAGIGEPHPYVAVLVADGDRMGQLLETKTTPDEQREVSLLLAEFATLARSIVEQDADGPVHGSLIYAGGDDVLAFVPVAEATRIADALRRAFRDLLAPVATHLGASSRPTLSVGIGVGHLRTRMGDLLALGRRAEKLAKGNQLPHAEQRNALAILVDKRSGGETAWRGSWDAGAVDDLRAACERIRGDELPFGKVQEVRRDLAGFPAPGTDPGSDDEWLLPLRRDIARTLRRADGVAPLTLASAGLTGLAEAVSYPAGYRAVETWISLHLVARELEAAVVRSAGGAT